MCVYVCVSSPLQLDDCICKREPLAVKINSPTLFHFTLPIQATSSAIAAEWTVYSGSLPQGGDVRPPGNYTTKEAELLCSNLKWCAGFTFSALYNISVTPVPTYFKGAATGTKQGGNPPWCTSSPSACACVCICFCGSRCCSFFYLSN